MNAYEQIGRERKAQAIVRFFWRQLPREDRVKPTLVVAVAAYPQESRDEMARLAGTHEPSEETWARVVALVAERVEDEQRWLGMLDEPRAAS